MSTNDQWIEALFRDLREVRAHLQAVGNLVYQIQMRDKRERERGRK